MAGANGREACNRPGAIAFGTVPEDQIQRAYRIRVGLFFSLVVLIVAALMDQSVLTMLYYSSFSCPIDFPDQAFG
jgi:hypothetical protein